MPVGRGPPNAAPPPCPASWTCFFPAAEYQQNDRRANLVHDLLPFLCSEDGVRQYLSKVEQLNDDTCIMRLNFKDFTEACGVNYIVEAVSVQPDMALACISIAIHEALVTEHKEMAKSMFGSEGFELLGPPKLRLFNYSSEVFIRSLKGSSIGRLVTIRGTVVRMGARRPLATQMEFLCGKCGSKVTAKFPEGKFSPPTKCSEQGCRSRTFAPNRSSVKCVDWIKCRVQELVGADKQQAGQVPRTIEVELWGDLVHSCMVGDVVVVTGMVKVLASGDDLGKLGHGKGAKQDLFLIYLEALSVQNPSSSLRPADGGRQRQAQPGGLGMPPNMPSFSERDLEFITKFTQEYDGDQLRQLVHSLCPSIYGHELVKAGLLLALVGGVRKNVGCVNRVPTRGDVHVLVVGDPGLGKSQLLQAAAASAPRGVYVCGKTSSSAGLTVSVVRDNLTGDFVFEAGAVVMADRGTCCIDEFDKMTHEHQALLEAMEQQEVSVAKAGLVASLPARVSILAAANPVGGHYNRAKSVGENLKMSPAMLSRFDLIFILMDRPDDALDQCVSEHVLALHSGMPGKADAARQRLLEYRPTLPMLPSASQVEAMQRPKLSQRLLLRAQDDDQPLPQQLLKKYIAYARQYVHPRLSDEAREVLQSFYLHLRQQAAPGGSMPVTARQLESLARLAEARARIELREEVTRHDAEDVVEIMREALYDRVMDDIACVDFRPGCGTGSRAGSKAAEAKRFLTALRRAAERQGQDTFTTGELMSIANDISLQVKDIQSFVEQLNEGGDLLKAGSGQYRVRGINPAASQAGLSGCTQGGTQAGYGRGPVDTPSERWHGSSSQFTEAPGRGGYTASGMGMPSPGWFGN